MNFTGSRVEKPKDLSLKFPSVVQYMATDEITLSPDLPIDEAINIILDNKLTGVPVLNKDKEIVGMLTEKDCLRLLVDGAYNNMPNSKVVADYMTPMVKTVSDEHDILDVANEFLTTNFRKFPVVRKGKLIGQVSRRDILKAIRETKATTW